MFPTQSLLNVPDFFSLSIREWHVQTYTHTLALYCSKYNSSSRVKFKTLENKKGYTKMWTRIFQFLGLRHSNLFWEPWITTTLMAVLVYCVPTTCGHCYAKFCRQVGKKVNHIEEGIRKPFFGNKIIYLLFWLLPKFHRKADIDIVLVTENSKSCQIIEVQLQYKWASWKQREHFADFVAAS